MHIWEDTVTLNDRFQQGYKVENDCWLWQLSKDKDGYGYIKKNNKTHKAHRISYELHHGDIPDGMWVLHKCDNPSCVNPDHLWLGTAQDNNDDMVNKGRGKYPGPIRGVAGEINPNAKLTQKDVDWIRANYRRGLGPVFAEKFGVGAFMINRIIRGEAWNERS